MKNYSTVDNKRKQVWRQLWLDIHFYLGLWIGAFLVILGLTGSILVFFQEIDEWLNPDLLTVSVPRYVADDGKSIPYPIDQIIHAADQVAAQNSSISMIYGPRNKEGVFAIYADQESGDWQRIFVNPYQAKVTGVRSYSEDEWFPDYLIDFIFQLHFSLLLGSNGIVLVAVIALLLLISLTTGLIVWWPKTGQWRKALTIKWNAGSIRLNFDLHKTFSCYFCVVLGALLLSGVYMNLNDPFVWVTQQFSPATRDSPHHLVSISSAAMKPIRADQAWTIAADQFPDGELKSISVPDSDTGVYVITQKNIPGLSTFWCERHIAIDQYSGEVLDVRAPDTRRSAGETFLDWQWPLHSGNAFGWMGRILIFLCGLACPIIYFTGVIRWIQKRRIYKLKVNTQRTSVAANRQSGDAV